MQHISGQVSCRRVGDFITISTADSRIRLSPDEAERYGWLLIDTLFTEASREPEKPITVLDVTLTIEEGWDLVNTLGEMLHRLDEKFVESVDVVNWSSEGF